MTAVDGKKYQVAGYIVDTVLYRVSSGSAPIPVEPKVFDLLVYLIRHRDRVLSREELFKEVWDGREVSDATLSNHIKSVRKILGDNGEQQQTILTVRGRGYQFIAPVAEVPGNLPGAGANPAPTPVTEPDSGSRPNRLVPLVTAILLLVGIALLFALRHPGTSDASARSGPPHILVVPMEVSGAELATWQPWADELTRRVISSLRQISGLAVKDRFTTFMFQQDRTHAYIRQQLPDVRYVLSSVLSFSAGNAPRVTMYLDDLQTGAQVFTRSYAYPRSDDDASLAEMQSKITAAISDSLQVTILAAEKVALRRSGEPSTKNRQALELYVQGWQHMLLLDHASLKKAIGLFEQAIELDKGFFDAYMALGKAHRWVYGYYETPRDVLPLVEAAFEKARDLRPDSAEPWSELGLTYAMAWEWTRAWESLTRAQKMDPNLATTDFGFAVYYSGLGPVTRMKESLYRAQVNDPLNLELADWGNWFLFLNGETDASRAWANDMMSKHPSVGFITTDAAIGAYMVGDHPRAIKLAEDGRSLDDSPLAKIVAAQAYGFAGQRARVRPLLEAAASSGLYSCPYESAVGYLSIGDQDTAMQLLEQAYDKRSNCLVFLRVDPRLQPVREDPRYRERYLDLLTRVGLDEGKWESYPR
jgi:DNA-binding winged helix-turn-helix (wHTH) protein/tetratricopeptide (TPR) repeat protein/TolB-like protein